MAKSRWYDKLAPIYDIGTFGDVFYRRARKDAIDRLCLSAGSRVLDIFCGTGVDFATISNRIGQEGRILAVDGSSGMLRQAESRSARLRIGENRIDFLQADLSRSAGIDRLVAYTAEKKPSHVLFSLGLTCLENWYDLTSRILVAVQPGARLSIVDVYSQRLTLGARFINWIGAADCQRTVWKALEEKGDSFQWRETWPFKVLDVSVVVASATKPTNA